MLVNESMVNNKKWQSFNIFVIVYSWLNIFVCNILTLQPNGIIKQLFVFIIEILIYDLEESKIKWENNFVFVKKRNVFSKVNFAISVSQISSTLNC